MAPSAPAALDFSFERRTTDKAGNPVVLSFEDDPPPQALHGFLGELASENGDNGTGRTATRDGVRYMTARVDSDIVGALAFRVVPDAGISAYPTDHVGEFHIDVAAGAQGHGIGHLLMEALTMWAADQVALRKLQCTVLAFNQRAQTLFERHGFSVEGLRRQQFRVRTQHGHRYFDGLEMGLLLPR